MKIAVIIFCFNCCLLASPLHDAVVNNDIDEVKSLIASGADVNAKVESGETALMYASGYGYMDLMDILIQAGADINSTNNHGHTALWLAAQEGKLESAKRLITDGVEVDSKNESGQTPLFAAMLSGSPEIVDALIKGGANINTVDKKGRTALMITCLMNAINKSKKIRLREAGRSQVEYHFLVRSPSRPDKAIFDQLIAEGADISTSDNNGYTVLHFAATLSKSDFVSSLISSGADVNAKTATQETPLMIAASGKHEYEVKVHLKETSITVNFGADREEMQNQMNRNWSDNLLHNIDSVLESIRNGDPHTLSYIDETGSNVEVATVQPTDDIDIVRTLLNAGAKVDERGENSNTALNTAFDFPRREIIEVLIEHGANVNAVDKAETSPLSKAVKIGDFSLCNMLLESGANPNDGRIGGDSLLNRALSYRKPKIAMALIESGADVNLITNRNLPLISAAANGYMEIVKLIMSKGDDTKAHKRHSQMAAKAAKRSGHKEIAKFIKDHM